MGTKRFLIFVIAGAIVGFVGCDQVEKRWRQVRAAMAGALTIDYVCQCGLSRFKTVEAHVKDDGSVTVKYQRHGEEPADYSFALNRDELTALKVQVDAVRFFEQPTNDLLCAYLSDVGETTLTVSLGKRRRTLHFQRVPELEPLEGSISMLVVQAYTTIDLQKEGITYEAMGKVVPSMCAPKVYCPRLLADPFKEAIGRCQEYNKVCWGLRALSGILPADQWCDFVAKELAAAERERKAMLLLVLGWDQLYNNIPRDHMRALLPLLTSVLASFADTKGEIDQKTDKSLGMVCDFLRMQEYDQCLPTLERLVKVYGKSVANGSASWTVKTLWTSRVRP